MRRSERPILVGPLVAGLLAAAGSPARGDVAISQVGIEAVEGVGIESTLTGGFVEDVALLWTHRFEPIAGVIRSATLHLDLIDADRGVLTVRAGTNNAGQILGFARGIDQGLPGPWRDLQLPPPDGSYDTRMLLGRKHFETLRGGVLDIFAEPSDMGGFGINRALLVVEFDRVVETYVDIRPQSHANRVDPFGRGFVPVAVFGHYTFDVEDLDPDSLSFGPGDAAAWPLPAFIRDLDGDGFEDFVAFFRIAQTGIALGDDRACLHGETFDGRSIDACDAVDTFPGRRGAWLHGRQKLVR